MKTRYAYLCMVSSYLITLLILLLSTYAAAPSPDMPLWLYLLSGAGIWLFKILPLLLFVPGLIQRKHSTSAWLSYMTMLYFVLAVLLAFTPGASGWGWAMTISTLVMFLSSMLYTRWRKADLKQADMKQAEEA
ncbi:DUF2069 domain-containing protein [Thalassolituus sp. LLYu03]|uniref:DUF2069 domain-containing protein n=1 Tax=Thalassolituus sp. LLYu03 TaxID=3421656 RepID=UPI003D269EC4